MSPEEIRAAEIRGRKSKRNAYLRRLRRSKNPPRPRSLQALQRNSWDAAQKRLWWQLHTLFTHTEFVSYDDLPEKLKAQVPEFEEFLFDPRL
jgi:hypothetical protein